MDKKKLAIPLTALTLALSAGGGIVAAAHADTGTTTASTTSVQAVPQDGQTAFDPTKGGHVGKNGVRETLLTGDSATKATAAALAAVPGATIQRVENDADGGVYEAHLTKSDGSEVTVQLDANYAVTSTEAGGHGHGPHGGQPDNDADDAAPAASTTSS